MNLAACDIIIPVYNALDITKKCLDSIDANTRIPFNMILVDNGSDRDTSAFLDGFKFTNGAVSVISNSENLGWVQAVNQGMRLSVSSYVCIMNNDTVVRADDWLTKLIAIGDSAADIGLINPNFEPKRAGLGRKPFMEVDFCRGYCVLIKRAVMEKIGFLDEGYGLGYYDDDDYSVRAIRAGFRCVRANHVFVEHLRDFTFRTMFDEDKRMALHERNKTLFYSKWGRRLKLAFLVTKAIDRKKISELLISLARRQHMIYLWNCSGARLRLEHTLIRERSYPVFFPAAFFSFLICMNSRKKDAKRYNLIFTNSAEFGSSAVRGAWRVHCLNFDREAGRVIELVDSMARDSQKLTLLKKTKDHRPKTHKVYGL